MKEGGPRLNRREFLASSAAFGASMVPETAIQGLTQILAAEHGGEGTESRESVRSENQEALDSAIRAVQKNLESADVRDALEGRGKEPVARVLRAIELPILPESLTGTSYDTQELHEKYPVPVVFTNSRGGRQSGNGVLFRGEHEVLTAAHVIHGTTAFDTAQYPSVGIDVDLFTLQSPSAEQKGASHVIEDTTLTNKEIHGQFVSIVGFDPDQRERKTYAGVAVKVTSGLAEALLRGYRKLDAPIYKELLSNSFMFILPAGEGEKVKGPPGLLFEDESAKPESYVPRAAGMSGSPMFVHRGGSYVFGGIISHTSPYRIDGRSMYLGFAHGIDEVRKAVEARTRRGLQKGAD